MLADEWLDRPAVARISASTAASLRPFLASYNEGRSFLERVKPFNFLLCVQVAPFGHPAGYPPQRFQLIHPYEPDPRCWLELEWIDRYSGHRFRIHTHGPPRPDSVKVKTYRDILHRYRSHPEPKSLDPTGHACSRASTGLLFRRPVVSTEISYIGKESNRLEERTAGLLHDPAETLSSYSDPNLDPWKMLVAPTLCEFNSADVAGLAQLDRRTIQRLLSGRSYPHRSHRQSLTAVALRLAQASLIERGLESPRAAMATLRLYRDTVAAKIHACPICGTPLDNPRATYCGSSCKKRAYRARLEHSLHAKMTDSTNSKAEIRQDGSTIVENFARLNLQ